MAGQHLRTQTRTLTLATLALLVCLAFYAVWYKSLGLLASMTEFKQQPNLPHSTTPYKKTFTGIGVFDAYLSGFMCFFMPVAERLDDDLYLFWVWMIAQLGAVWGLMMLETVREGHKSKRPYVEMAITGMLFQNLGIGPVLPFMFMLNTAISEIANAHGAHALVSLIRVPIKHVNTLPWVLAFTFAFPTIKWMLPFPTTLNSAESAQGWVAVFQFFPVYSALLLGGLFKFFNWADKASGRREALGEDPIKSEEGKTIRYFYAAKITYSFFFGACALVHSTVLAILLVPEFAASVPGMPAFANSSVLSVFGASLRPATGQENLMQSLLNFLQWEQYIASFAAIVWAANLVRNAGENGWASVKGGVPGFVVRMLGYTLVAGPSGAAVMGLWERDGLVANQLIKEAREWAKAQKIEKSQ